MDSVAAFERSVLGGLDVKPLSANEFIPAQCDDSESVTRAAASLGRNGFVVIPEFVSRAAAAEAVAAIDRRLAEYMTYLRKEESAEFDSVIINCRAERFRSVPEMASVSKPIFNIRNGWSDTAPDAGFIDLFHPEKLIPDLEDAVERLSRDLPAAIVARLTGNSYAPLSRNLYLNMGITQTRGFHIDSHIPYIKAFLYLTDVLAYEQGPYCYIRGSHSEKLIKDLNGRYNALYGRKLTDMPLVDTADAVAFIAQAGTLILSIQSGIHRGYPQHPDRRRLALICSFGPSPRPSTSQ